MGSAGKRHHRTGCQGLQSGTEKLKKNPYNVTAQRTVREVEVFFLSDWFRVLTTVNGPMILKMLKEECGV